MNNEKQWLQKIAGIKTSLNESFFGGYVDLSPVNRLSEEMKEDEPEGDQYDGEYDGKTGPAITNELEKPEKNYATDDSEDEKGFVVPGDDEEDSADMSNYDYMDSQSGLQVAQLAKEMIDDGFEPDDAAEFFRGFAARLDKGGFMKEDSDENNLKPSGELEW